MRLDPFFESEHIEYRRELAVADLKIWNREKFDRMQQAIGTVESAVVFLIPYYAARRATNLSVYAMPRDYHLYLRLFMERLGRYCKEKGFSFAFMGFTDSSPLDERDAALKAGLGVLGENGLILNEKYGSFCFIGEVFLTEKDAPAAPLPIQNCRGCRACVKACPTGAVLDPARSRCLSFLSQKKNRTPEEDALVAAAACKWGCDICQEVCPYNQNAALTPIAFFRENLVEELTPELIELEKHAFSERAFSWRGRSLLRRNLNVRGSAPHPGQEPFKKGS